MWDKLLIYIVTLLIFLILDFIWIGAVAKKFYQKHLGYLMRKNPNWLAAVVFYLIYIFGVIAFVLLPALSLGDPMHALLYGGLFGLVAYATYDLTNLSTVKEWPVGLTVVDIVWGSLVTAMTCFFSYHIIQII